MHSDGKYKIPGKRKSVNIFICETCGGHTEFSPKALKEHLVSVHKETSDAGKREMIMHADRTDSFMYIYRWTIGKIVLQQIIDMPRTGEDKQLWAAMG